MDRTKRARGQARAAVSRAIKLLEAEVAKDLLDRVELEVSVQFLDQNCEKLMELDGKVKDLLLDAEGTTDEELEKEFEGEEEYQLKVLTVKAKVQAVLFPDRPPHSPPNSHHTGSQNGSHASHKKTIKYPKIKMKMFSGNLTDWLGWWAQFEKIDEDEELHDSDKFVYLGQSMTKGSRAEELVNGYPPSAANYPKVIKALKEIFGNAKLLKQVYVRELISMIILKNNREKLALSSLYDRLESHLRSLESLGVTVEQMVEFLFPMVESSLPEDILMAWQRSSNFGRDGSKENPPKSDLDYLMGFLKQEIENEEQRRMARSGFSVGEKRGRGRQDSADDDIPTAAGLFSGVPEKKSCIFCDKGHDSKDCFKAKKMSLEEKKAKVQEKRSCYSCLRSGHVSRSCKSNVKCQVCGGRHPLVLCPDVAPKKSGEAVQEKKEVSTTIQSSLNCTSEVILRTLMVKIQNPVTRKMKRVRLLLDCGSQRSYILQQTAKELGLSPASSLTVNHQLFGGSEVKNLNHDIFDLNLLSSKGSFVQSIRVMDQEVICGGVPRVCNGPWITELKQKGIVVNDMEKNDSTTIELLVGADLLGGLLTGNIHQLENGLTATETRMGWCLMGSLSQKRDLCNLGMSYISMTVCSSSVTELWKLDTLGIRDPIEVKTKEERDYQAQLHFMRNVKRLEDGRYSISLPWVEEMMSIPSNKEVAVKRLESTTRRLNSLGMYNEYQRIFEDWEAEEIISQIKDGNEIENGRLHYLPHRPVLKLESKTTPIRPVFDASCKVGRAPSLNDCLERGPNLLELIPSILLRFRMKRIGVTSDIRKAFLMIGVNEEDRDSIRFLWWKDRADKEVGLFRHNRLVFGMTCSPFLLGAVINFHLGEYESESPEIVEMMKNSMYVDNCVLAVNTIEEYETFKEKATQILSDSKMELRQWEHTGDGTAERVANVLGLKWHKSEDSIYCAPLSSELPGVITKRVILSQLHHIFDPLGFLSPVLLIPKLLIQKAWIESREWDTAVSDNMKMEFIMWWNEMNNLLLSFRIPRNCCGGLQFDEDQSQVHVFCDASKGAYAAVVFLRIETEDQVSVQLLESKVRVAPVKQATIPRLELLSCTIGARLMDSVTKALNLKTTPTYYWSDSTTALSWIKRSDEWGTFVGNRVREILQLSNVENWYHVPGALNPADLPSRGIMPRKFEELKWWEGPEWLKKDRRYWPSAEFVVDEEEVNKERKIRASTFMVTSSVAPWYIVRNSYIGNLRILALVFRFVGRLLKKIEGGQLYPSAEEVQNAELRLFSLVQKEVYPSQKKVISGLRVDWDKGGIARVRTKLINRQDSSSFKAPVLLPHHHPFVELLIRDEHVYNSHAGTQFLMGRLRERCWVTQGRATIKKVLKSCVFCQRYTTMKITVPAAALPYDRVKDATAFEVTGIDLAGPLTLKNKKKVWFVLFTCGVYRGIHLELVESLSTEDFLLAFTRFCRRKRRPSTIYTDNGTNFVGAANLFKKINWVDVEKRTKQHRINWKFIPPSAPWWGGWWERLIRTVKDLLKRMLGFGKLSYVELETCLCEVEAVVNHRPLTFVTEDLDDLVPLTPAMFEYDLPFGEFPEANCLKVCHLGTKTRDLRKLLQELRGRFRKEYLGLLVERGMVKETKKLKVGEFVLVGREDRKRIFWPMARILELIPGTDGEPRMARLQTKNGVILRALQRLYPLEFSQDETLYPLLQKPLPPTPQVEDETLTLQQEEARKSKSGRVIKKPIRFCDY